MSPGSLSLLPNLLDKEADHDLFLPPSVSHAVNSLEGLIAESEKEGRAFLKRLRTEGNWKEIPIWTLNEHTLPEKHDELLAPMRGGEHWGLISDAGQPCLADPGYRLVARARELGIAVKAFVGPSSIPLALMLSGLPAQRFAFHGYLPKREVPLKEMLYRLEQRAKDEKATQLFIEAPYRNDKLLQTILNTLAGGTLLCVACDLTFPTQTVITHSIATWKKRTPPHLHKRPAVFLLL